MACGKPLPRINYDIHVEMDNECLH
jgi:hypothetical protein